MPNIFNFAQQEDPETYNKVQYDKQEAKKKQSERLSEINNVYDAAQGQGTSQSIRAGLDEVARNSITPTESSVNSVKNMVNRLQGTIPRLNIVAADAWENVLGKELTKKWYEFEGRDIDQVRNDAYAELDALSQDVLPTLQLTNSIQDGSIRGIAAGMANAITSLGSSAIPAMVTGGAGIFTEMTGDALVDYNKEKAKKLGISVPELYNQDKADFAVPAAIGALGGVFEKVGLKGVKNMITKKVAGSGFKKAAIFFGLESNKEGITEWLQTGLEEANISLGRGDSIEETTKNAIDKMFSKGGLEAYLQGVAGSSGAAALGRVGKSLFTPSAKLSFSDEVAKVEMLEMDLRNPNLDIEIKEVIAKEADKAFSSMATIIDEDDAAENDLTPEQKVEAVKVNTNIEELQAIIDNPNVSDNTKNVIQTQIDVLNKEVEAIQKEEKVSVEETTEVVEDPIDTKAELTEYITQAEEIATQHEQLAEQETDSVEREEALEVARNAREVIAKSEQELSILEPEVKETIIEPKIKSEKQQEIEEREGVFNVPLSEATSAIDALIKKEKEKPDGYGAFIEMKDARESKEVVDKYKNANDLSDAELSKDFREALFGNPTTWYADGLKLRESVKEQIKRGKSIDEITQSSQNAFIKDGYSQTEAKNNVAKMLEPIFKNSTTEISKIPNEIKQPEIAAEEVVEEDLPQKRNEVVVSKAEDDLKSLKQVSDKVKKYEASMKRLTEAKNNKEISVTDFNDFKQRFDDVIGKNKPKLVKEKTDATEIRKVEQGDLTKREGTDGLQQGEQKNRNNKEVSDKVSKSKTSSSDSVLESRKVEEKIAVIQEKRQSIKDRISQKLKDQRSNLSSGFDPSLLRDFVELGGTYIEEGVVNVEDFIKRFREDYNDMGFDEVELTDDDIINEVYNESVKTPEQIKEDNDGVDEDIKEIGLTKKDVQDLRETLSHKQFVNEVKSNAERIREAKEMMKGGYNVADLVKKISESDYLPSGLEVELLKQYYSSLTNEINKNPTPENIKSRDDLLKVIDVVKVSQGRSVQAWDGLTTLEDNIANFLTEESKYTTLTQDEINSLTEKYNKAKEALEEYKKLQQNALNKANNKKAQANINKHRKSVSAKTKDDFKNERKKFVEDFRAELRKIRATPSAIILPYTRELMAAAPFVRKMVQSYVNEQIYDLKEIVDGIHSELRQDIPDITTDDVRDIIAGEYANPRQTKNAKLAQIRDIKRQAQLEAEIEKLNEGIIKTRNPIVKRSKNDKISELEQEIKDIKKRNPELYHEQRLDTKKKWFQTKIDQLKKEIAEGNYEPIEEPVPILLDNEALRLKDEYMKFKEETRARRDHAEFQASSKMNKSLDMLNQALELRRQVQTSLDLSIPLRQGVSIMMNTGTPFLNEGTTGIGIDAYQKMLTATWSRKNYDRLMFDIENSPNFLESKDDGIVYAEVGSANNENRDEHHKKSFLYKIPYLRVPFMKSERAASGWQNYARYQLYLRGMKMLESEGKTRQNSKKAYEQMAARVMVDTGRGKIPGIKDKAPSETDSRFKKVLGSTLYGARLASAIFRKLNPLYYFNSKVDRSVRIQALKDMAGYTTGLLITGLAFSAMGYSVSFDYDDPDFLKARKGKKVIDFTGGMATYVRTYLRLISMVYKRADPSVNYEDSKTYSKFALSSLASFGRNKLAPNTSYVFNMMTGENTIGEKFDPWEIIKIYPMYTDDIIKSFKEGNPLDLLTIIPVSVGGLGYMEYEKDIRRANLNAHLDGSTGKKVISFLKEHKLNIKGEINQEIYDINTGGKVRMTTEQSDRYEKLWADYILEELKEPGEIEALSKLSEVKFKKEINKIKLTANKYAKSQITGLPEGISTFRYDDKTYELTPEQVKKRVKLNQEFIKENGEELRMDFIDMFEEEGMSKRRAKHKAELELDKAANKHSRIMLMENDLENNEDGKITSFKEKE